VSWGLPPGARRRWREDFHFIVTHFSPDANNFFTIIRNFLRKNRPGRKKDPKMWKNMLQIRKNSVPKSREAAQLPLVIPKASPTP
jgi:hypothetical protein